MSELRAGMHDDPRLFPMLPGREPDESARAMVSRLAGDEWLACWEYVLTHELTDRERSAFWHGANLGHLSPTHDRAAARGSETTA